MDIEFDVHNIIIEITCLLLLVILNFSRYNDRKQTGAVFRSLDSLLITCLVYLCFRLFVTLYMMAKASYIVIIPTLLVVSCLCYLAAYFFFNHVLEVTCENGSVKRAANLINRVTFIICLIALLLAFINHNCYIIYDDGYMRGKYYFLIFVYPLIANMAAGVFAAFSNLPLRIKMSFFAYFIFLLISLGLQSLNPRISLLGIDATLAAVMVYSNACLNDAVNLYQADVKLTEGKYRLLMMQIQPHFLYNTLSTIQQLCVENPAGAEDALGHFAEFLRGNMDRLTRDRLVTFAKELDLTENYLTLEKYRFGDRINVEYDIQCDDFLLPPATVQLAVENAVRYGICPKIGGGTVKLSTRETRDSYVILIEDDGVGFDAKNVLAEEYITLGGDARSHIGLVNLRDRLRYLCNGTLGIESEPGVGTIVTITIPKESGVTL